jgi:hypothetical protein
MAVAISINPIDGDNHVYAINVANGIEVTGTNSDSILANLIGQTVSVVLNEDLHRDDWQRPHMVCECRPRRPCSDDRWQDLHRYGERDGSLSNTTRRTDFIIGYLKR